MCLSLVLVRPTLIQILEGRRWQLNCIREGFSQEECGATLLHSFLSIFKAGAERRRLVCGEESFTPETIIPLLMFDGKLQQDQYHLLQVRLFTEAIASLTPLQCKHFFRAVTAMNSIPEQAKIIVFLKDTDQHLTFSTCASTVWVPKANNVEEMRQRLIESSDPRNLAFGEAGSMA